MKHLTDINKINGNYFGIDIIYYHHNKPIMEIISTAYYPSTIEGIIIEEKLYIIIGIIYNPEERVITAHILTNGEYNEISGNRTNNRR